MKIILLLTALCFPLASIAQEAPKKAYRCVVLDSLSLDDNFKHAMMKLIEMGYEVDKTEREFGLITTKPREIPKLNGVYYLSIAAKDKSILVSGQLKMNINVHVGYGVSTVAEYSSIYNGGQKGSGLRRSFEQMDAFAKALSPYVNYEIKP